MKRQIRHHLIRLLLIMLGVCGLSTPWFGAATEKEFKMLKLVRTYQSEDEVCATYPEQFPKIETITPDGDYLQLANPEKARLKTFETEPLTEQERQHVRTSPETNPVFKNGVMRYLSNDRTFFVEADVTVKIREPGYRYEGDVETKKLTLYNARGEIVTQLSPEVTSLRVSPNRQYFVAYNWEEHSGPALLYFYQADGTLLQKQESIKFAQVEYSQNSEFVQVYSDMSQIFEIFTKTGKLIYRGNRRELIKHVRPILHGVFTSEQGDRMLLATSQHIHLYTTQGEFLWTNSFPGYNVATCWFFSQQEIMALKTVTSRSGTDIYNLQIHSLKTGDMLDQIVGIAEITAINNHLIIKKGGQYDEYQIQ